MITYLILSFFTLNAQAMPAFAHSGPCTPIEESWHYATHTKYLRGKNGPYTSVSCWAPWGAEPAPSTVKCGPYKPRTGDRWCCRYHGEEKVFCDWSS